MSSVVDNLVTHPNVMNGAMLYWPQPGMQYVEGHALDEFCAGRCEIHTSAGGWGGRRYTTLFDGCVERSTKACRAATDDNTARDDPF